MGNMAHGGSWLRASMASMRQCRTCALARQCASGVLCVPKASATQLGKGMECSCRYSKWVPTESSPWPHGRLRLRPGETAVGV